MPIPLYPDLPISRLPWVTIAIIILCLGLHWVNAANTEYNENLAKEIAQEEWSSLDEYFDMQTFEEEYRFILHDSRRAFFKIVSLSSEYPYILDDFEEIMSDESEDFSKLSYNMPLELEAFYEAFEVRLTRATDRVAQESRFSIQRAMISHQNHFNPWRWLTSSLIHGDWWHVGFNMIFFFAFGVLVETIINSTRRYVGHMLTISMVVGFSDYLLHITSNGLYTLGFSGVVMGVIGMSAYLAPKARIRTLQFIGPFYARNFSVPAWILAVFFIGGDMYSMATASGYETTNFFAHIVGGVSGYLLAYLFLKDRKEDIADELEDAIELRRAQRADKLSSVSSANTAMRKVVGEDVERANRKAFEHDMAELYRYVETRQYARGNILLLEIAENHMQMDLVRLWELFDRIKLWTPSPVALNLARLLINSAMANKRLDIAEEAATWAIEVTPNFVLADPVNAPFLAEYLLQRGHVEAGGKLISEFKHKYFGYGDQAAADRVQDLASKLQSSMI